MRRLVPVLACLLAPAALAQTSSAQALQDLAAAGRERNALMAEADAAVTAADWTTACQKAEAVFDRTGDMLNILYAYEAALKAEGASPDGAEIEAANAQTMQVIAEMGVIMRAQKSVCDRAGAQADPS